MGKCEGANTLKGYEVVLRIGVNEVAVGSLTGVMVHPREVLKPLLLTQVMEAVIVGNAAGFICLHNHNSTDPTPSGED